MTHKEFCQRWVINNIAILEKAEKSGNINDEAKSFLKRLREARISVANDDMKGLKMLENLVLDWDDWLDRTQ